MKITVGPELCIEDYTEAEQEKLRDICTGVNPEYSTWERTLQVRPQLRYSKKAPEKFICLHRYVGDKLFVPRGLLNQLKAEHNPKIRSLLVAPPQTIPLKLIGVTLRQYQIEAITKMVGTNFGILEAPTGSGKTVMGLAIAEKLNLKTLFVVHTKLLLNQTIKEIKDRFGVDAGVIGDGKFEIKDFTVAMVQTMLRRDMSPYAKEFGTIIFDECHHVPAKTFIQITKIFYAMHVYGLSATLDRSDGLSWIMWQVIGPKTHSVDKKSLQKTGTIIKPKIIRVDTPYIPAQEYDPFEVAEHINALVADKKRDAFVIQYIKNNLAQNLSSVILTDRVNQVEDYFKVFSSFNPIMYHGQMSKKDQLDSAVKMKGGQYNLTIATYTSIGEGFDIPVWEQLFLVTPFSSHTRLTQVLGRISRAAKGKLTATVHDFVDKNDSLLLRRFEKRVKCYENL